MVLLKSSAEKVFIAKRYRVNDLLIRTRLTVVHSAVPNHNWGPDSR